MSSSDPGSDEGTTHVDPGSHAAGKKKIVHNIQSLRGLAALSVVLFHMMFIEQKYGHGTSVLPGWLRYGISSVDLFFVISGFVMVTVTRGKFTGARSAGRFLYQRAARIYPVYWCYSLLVLVVFFMKPTLVNSAQGNQVNLVASFLLLPDRLLPLLNVGWSLVHEVYFYFVFGGLLLLRDERRLPLALLVWGILVAVGQIAMATFHTEPSPTLKLIAHPMTYEFIAGCLIALWMHHRGPILSGTVLTLGIILLAIASVKLTAGLNIEEGWPRVLVFGIPSVLIVYGAVGLEFAGRMTMPKWTEQVGDASYSIYLSHVLILSALGRLWFMTDWHGQVATFVVLMGMFVVVMVVGFASYFCLERPIHEFTRRSVSWSSRPKNTVAASTAK